MANASVPHRLLTHHIYALIDPRTETIFYVGQTINMENRFWAHKSCGRKAHEKSARIYQVIKEIYNAGFEPYVVELDSIETTHEEIALRLEECWRIEMISRDEILANRWKTGRCIDTENPMQEAAYIKQFALATDDEIAALRESDKVRAMQKVWG